MSATILQHQDAIWITQHQACAQWWICLVVVINLKIHQYIYIYIYIALHVSDAFCVHHQSTKTVVAATGHGSG